MKRFLLSLVLVTTLSFFSGCTGGCTGIKPLPTGEPYYKGVDVQEFSTSLSSFGTAHLVSEDFLTKFEYGDNKFYWDNNEGFFRLADIDKTLMYLEYTDDVYEEAKNYILTEMDLDLSQEKNYNGYIFHFNNDCLRTNFPYVYLIAGYNDSKNKIVFLGIYASTKKHPELDYGETDFGKYLKMVYGEFYDFDA